ncbi:MAG: urease accessory protein UreD [Bacilli bacterium]|jgi:urease accessory protein|nr:urease accessory protein UreD [Bacilli bacterium]
MSDFTGELEASFVSYGGGTELNYRFHKSPLKIAKTFLRDRQQIGVCVMDCSPGMMAGDRYRLKWRLSPTANVYITNQSYTKVYPSREQPAYQIQSFHVAADARLEYKPEPIMLYKDASFRSDTEIYMAAGSVVFFCEIVCPGRVLRGEVFQYAFYDSRLKVHYNDQLIYYNRQFIQANHLEEGSGFRRLGGWGGYTHQGALYVFFDQIKSEHLASVRELFQDYPQLLCGVSLTYQHGIIVSAMGKSVWEIQQLLDDAWRIMKAQV